MTRKAPRHAASRQAAASGSSSTVVKILLIVGVCLVTMSLLPMIILETTHPTVHDSSKGSSPTTKTKKPPMDIHHVLARHQQRTRETKDGRTLLDLSVEDLIPDTGFAQKPIARGVAGSAVNSPGLVEAVRASIECDVNVDSLAYWNEDHQDNFVSPFAVNTNVAYDKDHKHTKYVTFSPDRGGWNNVRMSLEIIFVICAATGRTLVLPPKEPLYLMHHDKENRYRGFADFFPLDKLQKKVRVITFEDYLKEPKAPEIPADLKEHVHKAADHCDKRDKSPNACKHVFDYLEQTGSLVEVSAQHTCLVFDEHAYNHHGVPPTDPDALEHVETYCGSKRDVVYWTKQMNEPDVLFFATGQKKYRLLTHFYGMIHFTSAATDHYFKRFVRDYLHYHDAIYCAAGKIVKAVQAEAAARSKGKALPDENGAGGFSALHVRRGDLQYKKVKIPAQEWYDNTAEVWLPNELMYVATDERNKTFFDDFAKHHDLRFLDDYWDLAGLSALDPNYMGMIDTIVASRGRAFAGTWFSTFSGYINRLRGYHGLSMKDSWYSFLPKKTAVQEWEIVDHFAYAYEWPDGWIGIDADEWPSRDKF